MTPAPAEAGPVDFPAIAALMNRAYRGAGGRATEAGLIAGARTSPALLAAEQAHAPEGRLLVTRDGDRALAGGGAWHLGSLTVEPRHQAGGVGRRLLAAAEAWTLARDGRTMGINVVHVHAGLIALV